MCIKSLVWMLPLTAYSDESQKKLNVTADGGSIHPLTDESVYIFARLNLCCIHRHKVSWSQKGARDAQWYSVENQKGTIAVHSLQQVRALLVLNKTPLNMVFKMPFWLSTKHPWTWLMPFWFSTKHPWTWLMPFWFSTKHPWILLMPFWFSTKHPWTWLMPFWFSTKHLWIWLMPFWFSTKHPWTWLMPFWFSTKHPWIWLMPFWFSTKHPWIWLMPFWLSTNTIEYNC